MSEESKTAPITLGTRVWELPPLILHPFSNQRGPGVLLEGSKAALMLAGLLPGQGEDHDELKKEVAPQPLRRNPHALLRGQGSAALDRAVRGSGGTHRGTGQPEHP